MAHGRFIHRGRFTMAKVKVSSEVKAPVERVFELFTDIEHAADRVSGIKKIEVMSTGPFNLGYRWTETREVMGRLDNAAMEISAFERNRSYTITHHKGGVFGQGVRIDTTFTFEPVPIGTRVSIEFELHPEGLPPGTLLPLEWAIGGKVRHVLSEDLDDLMRAVETMTRT
jgi:carbon monoxide dehydrogenase subunit G